MSFDAHHEAALIDAVRTAARSEIMPRFRNLPAADIATKSAPDDLVTVADRAAERAITDAVQRILPEATVVGEEAAADDPAILDRVGTGLCVIIDPIDGTWNFANGLSVFGVIVAVVSEGRTIWGMLYDPTHDDWIAARVGQGAWFCAPDAAPRAVQMGSAVALDRMTGLIVSSQFPAKDQLHIAQTLPRFHRVTNLMCSCHEYRLLAQGSVDFCLNAHLNPWDHAAGALIVQEAGGVARLLDGADYRPTRRDGRLLLAKSEASWAALADIYSALIP
ncbi:inositol monophosphatase family protein [Gymnodinialimonas ulvae]|uniref:inositol monophosphatase family protein n=1 Tax=Gymnodinialimonas ulvae TaxID=3126504 RepID=UPI0030B40C33